MSRRRARHAAWMAGLAGLAVLVGCSGPKDFDNENDTLRKEREALLVENADLAARLEEAEAKLAEIVATSDLAKREDPEGVAGATPRCAGLSFGRLTGPADRDEAIGADVVEVYIRPFDGRRRFIQITGWVSATVDLLPLPDPATGAVPEPRRLGAIELTPEQVREAYRSSPLGTHYTVEIPLDVPNAPLVGEVVVRVGFRDAQTGRQHSARFAVEGAW